MSCSVGLRIKKIIEILDLTQKEFAEEIGVDQSYISVLIKKPERSISSELANFIEEKMSISADWLLHGKGDVIRVQNPESSMNNMKQKLIYRAPELNTKLREQ